MPTIAELLEARGDIAQLEELKQRTITEDELMPLLHNRQVAIKDYEKELEKDYREKFPEWLNREDLEAMCLCITVCNLLEHYGREWLRFNRPKKAIQYVKTARTFLEKAIGEFTEKLPMDEKLRLIRETTRRLREGDLI